ncbi:hypothetical protein ACFTWS_39085 [Streptomyces sp. NPDC057027]|uniref:hypothetical protein n=1 Tax=unclassified Streptomyces TaxID=2593676 RepID=UPI0035DBCEF1
MERATEPKTGKKTLDLKRSPVRNLNDPLLTTQGWSLWTCDETALAPGASEAERGRTARRRPK